MDVFLGTIQAFAFPFAPTGWATCQGQMMPVSPNVALFSLIGVAYGGNGQTTFGLPDLQGRVAVGQGTGAGLQPYVMGQKAGSENITLNTNQMPMHTHSFTPGGAGALMVSSAVGTTPTPSATANTLGALEDPNTGATNNAYNNATPDITLNTGSSGGGGTIGMSGGSQPFSVLQPFQVVNYCIAIQGLFPSRN